MEKPDKLVALVAAGVLVASFGVAIAGPLDGKGPPTSNAGGLEASGGKAAGGAANPGASKFNPPVDEPPDDEPPVIG
jgi:hypothetical protein